jgi:hypothetical protein
MGPDRVLAAFRQVLIQFHVEKNFDSIQKLDYSLIEWKKLLRSLKFLKKAIRKQSKTISKSKKRKQPSSSSSAGDSILLSSKKLKSRAKTVSQKEESSTNMERASSSTKTLSMENPSDKTSMEISVPKFLGEKARSKSSKTTSGGKQAKSRPLNSHPSPNPSPTHEKETPIKDVSKPSILQTVSDNEIVPSHAENDVLSQPDASKRFKEPYRRVNSNQVSYADSRLKDNSFLAKEGADFSYGYKAHKDLVHVRGKDFRHEKTKKKKGSYRGGMIDTSVHSIKFDE